MIRATTRLRKLPPEDQSYFISRHVQRTFESLSRSAEKFLDGIDNIILMPAITPYALKSKYQRSGSALLQSWVSRKLGDIETGKKYVALLRRLYKNYEYEASATQYENQVESIAERASQVENPGIYALISTEEGSAQPVLILSDNQLRKISPSHSFQGTVQSKSRLTPQFIGEWEKTFKCDIGYLALYDAVKDAPVTSFVDAALSIGNYAKDIFSYGPLMPMANVALSCNERYSLVSSMKVRRADYYSSAQKEKLIEQLSVNFNSQKCIPVQATGRFDPKDFNFLVTEIHSICPITAAARQ